MGSTSISRLVVLDTDLHGRSFPRNCLGCRRQPSLPGGHGKARPSYQPFCTTSRFPAPSGQRRCSALRWPKQLREKLRTRMKLPCNPCSSVSQIRSLRHFPTAPHRIGRAFKDRTAQCVGLEVLIAEERPAVPAGACFDANSYPGPLPLRGIAPGYCLRPLQGRFLAARAAGKARFATETN